MPRKKAETVVDKEVEVAAENVASEIKELEDKKKYDPRCTYVVVPYDVRINSKIGHTMEFKANVETKIPPRLLPEVEAVGGKLVAGVRPPPEKVGKEPILVK